MSKFICDRCPRCAEIIEYTAEASWLHCPCGHRFLVAEFVSERRKMEQLSEDKLREIVAETAAALGIEGGKQNMGKLMGPVMAKVKGLADGNAVKKVVQEFLG